MTNAQVQQIWNSLEKHNNTEARVFACAVSAHENNGLIVTSRAKEVMEIVWPQRTGLDGVPSEIRGTNANESNNRNRKRDFDRLATVLRRFADLDSSKPAQPATSTPNAAQTTSTEPATTLGAGFGNPVEIKQVELAAIQAVVKHYQTSGWSVRSVEREKCGFDLECTREPAVEQVEVKGVSGTAISFVITANEVKHARENSKFVLVVVTSALSVSPSLTRFSGEEFCKRFDLVTLQYKASLKR